MRINGGALREIRTRTGYSQIELARRAGVDKSLVSLVESGKRNPSPTIIRKLADALGCPLYALLGPEGEAA